MLAAKCNLVPSLAISGAKRADIGAINISINPIINESGEGYE